MGAGFIISSLRLLPLLYITQHFYGDNPPPTNIQPASYGGLDVLTLCGTSHGGVAVSERGDTVLIKCTGVMGDEHTATATALLSRQQRDGTRFLEALTEEVGWSVALLDFKAGTMTLATDAYASRPIFVASGPLATCQQRTPQGACPQGDQFAVSSHRSALQRLGFSSESISALAPSTVQVYRMRLPPNPSLAATYSLELQSFARPVKHVVDGPGVSAAPDGRFGVTLKRALGRVLRHPAANAGPPGLAPLTTAAGVIIDRPRFHVFLHGEEECSNHQDPILNSLASLPVPFVIYVASAGGSVVTRIWYEHDHGEKITKMQDLDVQALSAQVLARAEPLNLDIAGTGPQRQLALALAAACHDASLRGSRLLVSSTHALTPHPSRAPSVGEGLHWWLRLEHYVAQAAGLVDVVHPLLYPEVARAYASLPSERRVALQHEACSGAFPHAPLPPPAQETDGKPLMEAAPQRDMGRAPPAEEKGGKKAAVEGQKAGTQRGPPAVARWVVREAGATPKTDRPAVNQEPAGGHAAVRGMGRGGGRDEWESEEEEEFEDEEGGPAGHPRYEQAPHRSPATGQGGQRPQAGTVPQNVKLPWKASPHFMALLPAYLLREGGDFDKARAHLSQLLSTVTAQGDVARVANVSGEMGVTYEMQGRMGEAIRWFHTSIDTDPSYHEGYLLFARLFLGPESPFVRLPQDAKMDVVAVLREQVGAPLRSADNPRAPSGGGSARGPTHTHGPAAWRELAMYNLASALHYTGQADEAQEVYTAIVTLPPPGARTQQPSPARRPLYGGPSRVHVMAVASSENPQLGNLRASATAAGLDLHVLGLGVVYSGHEVKLSLYLDFLESQVARDDDVVVAVDAYDVVLFPALREAAETFSSSFRRAVVFGAERACWPDEGVAQLYTLANRTHPSLPFYLNSGSFMGRVADLRSMLHTVMRYDARFASDQRLFTRFYLEHPEVVELDHDSRVFYMAHSTTAPLVFDHAGRMHVPGLGTPGVVHANAGDGKHLYKPLVEGWRRASTSHTVVVTLQQPYFRGIAHHGRGEKTLALWNFLLHVGTGTEFVAEACYNAGFLLHSMGQRRLGRLLYIRSLQLGSEVMQRAVHNLLVLEVEHGSGHTREALSAVYRAHVRRPSDTWLVTLIDLLSDAMTDLFRTTVNPARLQPPGSEDLLEAYDTRGGDSLAWISEGLPGLLGEELAEMFEEELSLSKAYIESPYLQATAVACDLLGWTNPRRDVEFGVDQIIYFEELTTSGRLHDLCASLFATKDEAPIHRWNLQHAGAHESHREEKPDGFEDSFDPHSRLYRSPQDVKEADIVDPHNLDSVFDDTRAYAVRGSF